MREMKDSGIEWIGEIPKEWELRKGRYVFSQRYSKGNSSDTLLAATQKYGMYPQNLIEGVVQVKEDTDIQTFKTVCKNDYVISLRSFQGGFEMADYEGVCSPAYQVFCNNASISHQYYKHLFKSDGFIQKLNSLTVGIREGKNIQYKDFANMLLPFPPNVEQERIASFIISKYTKIDRIIEQQQSVIGKLKEYKQSVITEAVTKGLNTDVQMKDSGIKWLGMIPEHWDTKKLKYLASVKSGDSIKNEELSENGIIEVFGGNGLMGYTETPNIEGEHIIIGRVGALCGNVRYAKTPKFISDNALILTLVQGQHYKYYLYLLEAANIGRLNTSNAQPLITGTKILNIKIPNIPIELQKQIAYHLDNKCDQINLAIEKKVSLARKLTEYKKSLIYEAVTGKLEV